jgi:hypothetical protein
MTRLIDPLEQQEIDLEENDVLIDLNGDIDKSEAKESAKEAVEPEQEFSEVSNTLPDKYSGKSMEDVVTMHQEAEKLAGRQGSELGELRKAVDDLLKTKLNEAKAGNEAVEDTGEELDFFNDPTNSVNRAVENSGTVKEMRELLKKQGQQEVMRTLSTEHPDYVEVIQDSKFVDWIKASAVRTELLQRADNYDLNAARELLGNWKEIKGIIDKTESINEQDRKQQRKAASTGGRGSSEPMSRKIYRRSDLVNLMKTNPQKYMDNVEEFDRAYKEKRVK